MLVKDPVVKSSVCYGHTHTHTMHWKCPSPQSVEQLDAIRKNNLWDPLISLPTLPSAESSCQSSTAVFDFRLSSAWSVDTVSSHVVSAFHSEWNINIMARIAAGLHAWVILVSGDGSQSV